MAKLVDILRPRPRIDPDPLDPTEDDLLQARIADRVARLSGSTIVEATDQGQTPDEPAEGADRAVGAVDAGHEREPGDPTDAPRPPVAAEEPRFRLSLMADRDGPFIGTLAMPDEQDPAPEDAEPAELSATEAEAAPAVEAVEALAADDGWPAPWVLDVGALATSPSEAPADVPVAPVAPASGVHRAPRPRRPAAPRTKARTKRAPVRIPPYCPSCAVLLEPPPRASRRCEACRQRIIVRHVDSRTVYLAEAVVPVFEAERRRTADAARLERERDRWLALARAVGASVERVERLAAAPSSAKSVDGARSVYLAAADRAFRAARRDRRWVDASRFRRGEALALYHSMGSPVPPPADVLRLHREGVAAELRGLAELARDAELVGAACCDTCRADAGRVSPIAAELREPRLPHDDCPKGLCRCHWSLGARHRTTVQQYLRRRDRAAAPPNPAEPSPD
jgi:hypothetical protein